MEQGTADLGTKSGLTQPLIAGFDAQAVRLSLVEEMYRALALASCWCTEKVWYMNLPPVKCSRCKAKEKYEATL